MTIGNAGSIDAEAKIVDRNQELLLTEKQKRIL